VNASCASKQGKNNLLDTIALHVENLQLIVVLIILTIGIASKGMLGEFNDAVRNGNCEGMVVVGVGKVFFKGCYLQ
jgi:hypothetical protein